MIALIFTSLIINFLIVYKLNKISNIFNIFDEPDNKLKKHKLSVPLLGGIIILINHCFFTIFYFFYYSDLLANNIPIRNLISIFIFVFLFFFLGILDDKHKLKPENKFYKYIYFFVGIIVK